jgi:hypothetical protein
VHLERLEDLLLEKRSSGMPDTRWITAPSTSVETE